MNYLFSEVLNAEYRVVPSPCSFHEPFHLTFSVLDPTRLQRSTFRCHSSW